MRVFDSSITLYRKTVKRVRPLHRVVHWLMTHTAIPLLERLRGFRTMPDDPFWMRFAVLIDRYEPETVQQLERLAQPGMTVLDVGAHVGYYARRLAKRVGPTGRVIAFEPHPRTFDVLSHNIAGLKNVTAVQVAAAEVEGTAELYDYLMMSASGSLHYNEALRDLQKAQLGDSDIAPRLAEGMPVQKYTVRTTPLDVCLRDRDIPQVDVVKMDIEGAEIGALRGLRETIAASPRLALVMEFNPQALHAFAVEPEAAIGEVLGLGFTRVQIIHEDGTLADITGDTATIQTLTARLMEHMGVVNLLFTRE